ncbi:uncharacterized protein LOC110052457 [Orbicella faveolata]|uniref:uncharacterized protein LOC110052457 n=1 Tax=Orbicella faveolata TaxID=48498 RepID=UPI0009E317AC|nr:uncharacterized protein LOC110052457 [Orbicella faveolata]
MNSKQHGALSNPAVKDKQVELTKASTVIQTYVSIILQQPDLKLNALPNLPAHQKTARDHANNWNDTILPLMSKTDADIIDYANKFDSFYFDLVKYAKDIKNPESKKNLVEGLNLLLSTIKQKDANVEAVVSDLSTFHKNLNTDYQNLQSDVNQAAVKIEGDSGELKALNDKLDAIHTAMHKDIGLMVGGAVTIVTGVVMIVVGAVTEIPSGGISTALIGGGVLVVSSGVMMETIGSTDYNQQIDKQKTVQEELKGDEIELTGVKTTKHQVTGFVDGLKNAIIAATSLKAAWQTLDADLEELITAIKDVDPNIPATWLLDELNRAKLDWQVALDQAKMLQPDGKVPTKLYKKVQDAFKQAKPPRQA